MNIETKTIIRPFKWDDLQEIVDIINAEQALIGNEMRYTVEDLRGELVEPGFYVERNAFVIETPEGRLAAFADVMNFEDSGRVYARGYVHPDYHRQGLGTQIVRAIDAHSVEITKHIPAEKPIYVQRVDLDTNVGFAALMQSEGYHHARHFYRMMIDKLPDTAPPLPEGITLRPFDIERDARAVYDAITEAFRDHWGGSVAKPYDLWRHYSVEKADFNPRLWMIAYDGDEFACSCLCRVVGASMPDVGYVGNLGVRRQWRRRGLGDALLRQAFVMFREMGYLRVALGVDAGSETNAVALYERAGMHVFQQRSAYRKMLRGDASQIVE